MTTQTFQTLDTLEVAGKRVLVRVDFNVPLKEGLVTDDTRIRAALPTIRELFDRKAHSLVLMTHVGRPQGIGIEPEFSTASIARTLASYLGEKHPVVHVADIAGQEALRAAQSLNQGEILLVENLRFDPREKKGDEGFAQKLAALGEVYVNDAFGTAHRAHASVATVARLMPSAAGLLMQREVETLKSLTTDPDRPFVAILGGSKVSDKIGVIEALLTRVDALVVGGAMCFTFLKAQGFEVGKSLVEDDWIERCKTLMAQANELGVDLIIPTDVVEAAEFAADAFCQTVDVDAMSPEMMGLDIGSKTVERIAAVVAGAKIIFWNGPMGVFEMPAFSHGTRGVAEALAKASGTTIIGGGDSVAAVELFNVADQMDYISTGGGASMKLLEGADMPALEPLWR